MRTLRERLLFHKRSVRGLHRLAAIFAAVVPVRRARHGIAALHRFIRRGRGRTIESVRGQSQDDRDPQNAYANGHPEVRLVGFLRQSQGMGISRI